MIDDSITHWICGIREGSQEAMNRLVERYFEPIMRLVRRRLPGFARRSGDEEDIALAALNSFLEGVQDQEFPKLDSRELIWKVLVTISLRKATKHLNREKAEKRGGGKVRGDSVFSDDRGLGGFERVAGESDESMDLDISDCAEQILSFLEGLNDPTLRKIAGWKTEGKTDTWIAEQLQCSSKTVQRKMNRLRTKVQQWLDEPASEQDSSPERKE